MKRNLKTGLILFLFGALVFAGNYIFAGHIAGQVLALTVMPQLKVDGLEGDEKDFIEKLQKRFKGIEIDTVTKTEMLDIVKTELAIYGKAYEKIDFKKLADLMDEQKGLEATMLRMGLEVTEIKGQLHKGIEAAKTVRKCVEEYVTKQKDAIQAIKNGEQRSLPEFSIPREAIKAAVTMTEGGSLGASAYLPNVQVLPGFNDLVRVQPTFWALLAKGATKANPLVWVNKTNKQGTAQFIGEGVLKPLASFELSTETSVPKKVAERMKISTEMLDDIDYITGMILDEIRYEVETAANAATLYGVNSTTNPKGVTKYASLYVQTGISGVPTPNNVDAVRAAVAQLRVLNFNGPLTAYINPIDAAVLDLSKSANGVYIIPPFTSVDGRNIAGVPLIEDNNIAQGFLLIGDMSKYKVLMQKDFFIQWGFENDDFTKNLVTVIGEMRFHQYVSANNAGAFLYDTFANIKTAIS